MFAKLDGRTKASLFIPLVVGIIDLLVRFSFFAASPKSIWIYYSVSFVFEALLLYLFLTLAGSFKKPSARAATLIIGAGVFGFSVVASWYFFSYFGSLPGNFCFSYMLEEREDFFRLFLDGATPAAIAGVLAVWAVFALVFLKAGGAGRGPGRKTLVALLVVALVLGLVVNNKAKKTGGQFLPVTDAIFSLKNTLVSHAKGGKNFGRLHNRVVKERPPLAGKRAGFNGILMINESLRRENMHVFGYRGNTTPRLDEWFAGREVYSYPEAFSNATLTITSVATLLTGRSSAEDVEKLHRYPTVYEEVKRLEGTKTALISSHGYYTANYWQFLGSPALDYFSYREKENYEAYCNIGADDKYLVERFKRFVDTVPAGENFFVVLHFNGTHYPYTSPDEFKVTDGDPELADYDRSIKYLDHNLGLILDELKKRGIDENTFVLLTSDHGENIESKGGRFGKFTRQTTQVPFFMHLPKAVAMPKGELAANQKHLVTNNDIFPTLMDLYGIPFDAADYPGTSLFRPVDPGRHSYIFNGTQKIEQVQYLGLVSEAGPSSVLELDTHKNLKIFPNFLDDPKSQGKNPSELSPEDLARIKNLVGKHKGIEAFGKALGE